MHASSQCSDISCSYYVWSEIILSQDHFDELPKLATDSTYITLWPEVDLNNVFPYSVGGREFSVSLTTCFLTVWVGESSLWP